MGLFLGREQEQAQASIDDLVGQRVTSARELMRPLEGEYHVRVPGQTKYLTVREGLLHSSLRSGSQVWQGKVFLETRLVNDWGNTSKIIFVVLHNDVPIGELSEFDMKAKDLLDFDINAQYMARAVISDDLIGSVVHLFVNPENKIA
jgi:hypothetical protein